MSNGDIGRDTQRYQYYTHLFQHALAERRRGGDPNALIHVELGAQLDLPPDQRIETMSDLASYVAHLASTEKGGGKAEPLTGGERLQAGVAEASGPLGRLAGKYTWPPEFKELMERHRAQHPVEAGLERAGGSLPSYTLSGVSMNPWLAGAGSAAVGGADVAAQLPPGAKGAAKTIGAGMLASGAAGTLSTGFLRAVAGKSALLSPGAETLEQEIEQAGGRKAILRTVRQMEKETPGVRPVLAETAGNLQRIAARGIAQRAPEEQAALLEQAQAALKEASDAKRAVGAKYDEVLARPIMSPKLYEIANRPTVRPFLKQLYDAGLLGPADVAPTARNAFDLYHNMMEHAEGLADKLDTPGGLGAGESKPIVLHELKTMRESANDLRDVLRAEVPGFEQLQAEYAPYIQREAARKMFVLALGGKAPESGMLPGRGTGTLPVEPAASTTMGQLKLGAKSAPWQVSRAALKANTPLMFMPAREALEAAEKMWPWYTSGAARAVAPSAGGTLAGEYLRQGLLTKPTEEQPQP